MTVGIQQLMWAIERRRDAFHAAVWVDGDLAAALDAAGPDCTLITLPAGTGAAGADLAAYLERDVLSHRPADLSFRRVSRTVDQRRVVEETMVRFTFDRELPWLLPGVPPTHRTAEVLTMSTVSFKHSTRLGEVTSRIRLFRTLWDQFDLCAQLDIDPTTLNLNRSVHAGR